MKKLIKVFTKFKNQIIIYKKSENHALVGVEKEGEPCLSWS